MARIGTCLWIAGRAEEAARFYTDLFSGSEMGAVRRSPGDAPDLRAGEVVSVDFTLNGRPFTVINAGARFDFTPAVSIQAFCADQAESDRVWAALTADDGQESRCGWCRDRFGVHWQVVPDGLGDLLEDADPARAKRAFAAMMGMRRLDLAAMRAAADQGDQ